MHCSSQPHLSTSTSIPQQRPNRRSVSQLDRTQRKILASEGKSDASAGMQQPGMAPYWPAGGRGAAEAPSPISSRPPAPGQQQLDELGGASGSGGSGSLEHEGLTGEEGERGGSSAGNRWPRQETLALIKIRSEMDAAFREAALKGPLWEEASRRLAEMGYRRSAKKCREKFENVDKYYKRTKDGRAGRGDGKAYRFFSELEALHGAASAHPTPVSLAPTPFTVAPPVTPMGGASGPWAARVHAEPPPPLVPRQAAPRTTDAACVMTMGDVSFSLGSEGSDGEDTEETAEGGKRKRRSWGGGGEAMRFFEGLMRQVMERQEAMQRRFLEAIDRREQDRMIREEAWRRQEVARLAREQDALAKERAMAASRDAAIISFIQRVTNQTIPLPPLAAPAAITSLIPPPLQPTPVASSAQAPPLPQHQQAPSVQPQKPHIMLMTPQPQPPHAQSKEVVRAPESQDTAGSGGGGASSSRWPKAEVHALIQLRTELETRYQDVGPKGPLWEDISAGMRRLGYSRSAKRCKEKWENINKYFKKVKESNKKRPEDSKTCPYYHQLEALYRSKALASSGAGSVNASPRPEAAVTVLAAVPLSQTAPAHAEHGGKNCSNGSGNGCASRNNGGSSGGMQMKASNGNAAARFPVEGAGNGMATNKLGLKQEGVVKETTTSEQRPQPVTMNSSYSNERMEGMDSDSDSVDEDDDEFDDEDDDACGGNTQVQYDVHFQRQHQMNVVRPNASGGNPPAAGPAAPAGTAAATSGASFLAMVQ